MFKYEFDISFIYSIICIYIYLYMYIHIYSYIYIYINNNTINPTSLSVSTTVFLSPDIKTNSYEMLTFVDCRPTGNHNTSFTTLITHTLTYGQRPGAQLRGQGRHRFAPAEMGYYRPLLSFHRGKCAQRSVSGL